MGGNADYRLQVTVEWPDEEEPRSVVLSGERPGVREEAEYSGLIGKFVQDAEQGLVHPDAVAEFCKPTANFWMPANSNPVSSRPDFA